MPSGKVKERTFTLVPEDWYAAKLLSVEEREVGSSSKLKWKWEILDANEPELVGKWVWGDCWSDLDQSDGCVWRRWQEAHADHEITLDADVDTDDVLNLMVYIRVTHRFYYPKGVAETEENKKWVAEVPDDPEAVQPISADLATLKAALKAELGGATAYATQQPDF